MSAETEGTIVLDGLIEGRLPPDPAFAENLRGWVAATRGQGLPLDLELEGDGFGLLADHVRLRTERLGANPSEWIRGYLERFVALFPDLRAAGLFSTLRSVEYAPGEAIQTVYVIQPDGSVEAAQRSIEARTSPPSAAPSRRDVLRTGLLGLLVLAALLGVASLFVDLPGFVRSLWHKVTPLDAEAVTVDGSRFAEFLVVEKKVRGAGSKTLDLELRRTAAYPQDEAALSRLLATEPLPYARRLALESLAKGYVRFEVFAEDGTFLAAPVLRVRDLATNASVVVRVPVPRDPRPASVILTW